MTGLCLRSIATLPNTSESKRRFAKAKQRLRWLASIVESSDDAIVSKNLDGIITSWNRGAERVFGYTAEEAIGQPITIVIPQDRHDEERTILTRIRRGERIDHFETVRQRKHGSLIVVSLTVSPVKNADGKNRRSIEDREGHYRAEAELRSKSPPWLGKPSTEARTCLRTCRRPSSFLSPIRSKGLKQAIEGRIRALANVHSLFVRDALDWCRAVGDRDTGACALFEKDETRVRIDGPQVLLEPERRSVHRRGLARAGDQCGKVRGAVFGKGRIDLKWSHEADGRLNLRWTRQAVRPCRRRHVRALAGGHCTA